MELSAFYLTLYSEIAAFNGVHGRVSGTELIKQNIWDIRTRISTAAVIVFVRQIGESALTSVFAILPRPLGVLDVDHEHKPSFVSA